MGIGDVVQKLDGLIGEMANLEAVETRALAAHFRASTDLLGELQPLLRLPEQSSLVAGRSWTKEGALQRFGNYTLARSHCGELIRKGKARKVSCWSWEVILGTLAQAGETPPLDTLEQIEYLRAENGQLRQQILELGNALHRSQVSSRSASPSN